jgi:hypothetical protein
MMMTTGALKAPPSVAPAISDAEVHSRNRLAFQLDKICRLLQIDAQRIQSTEQAVHEILLFVEGVQEQCPGLDINRLPKLLTPPVAVESLSSEQLQRLTTIESAFYEVRLH